MNLLVEKGKIESTTADVVVATHFEGAKKLSKDLQAIDSALEGYIQEILDEEGFEAKTGETLLIHTHGKLPAKRVLVLGMGKKTELTGESVRKAGAIVIKTVATVKADTTAVSLDALISNKLSPQVVGQVFAEGALLGSYQFLKYKGKEESEKAAKAKLNDLTIIAADATSVRKINHGVEKGQLYSEATIYTRDLVNEPAIEVKPKTLAKLAEELGQTPGITTKIYNEAALKKLKTGALLAVAAGSEEEPFMIHLSYKPKTKSKKPAKKVVICGKGITFDSGGLSLKPSQHMETMKQDMAGAATVLGVFSKIKELRPNVEVHGVIATTENMPSGKAIRPGDVVTAYNGKTIEITNTDAEGRLVLADALSWAEDTIKPDYMLDFATLTGSAIYALGQEMAACLGTDKKFMAAYLKASADSGELAWELPLMSDYRQFLNSPIADIQNNAKVNWAGATMGGLFLKEFIEDTPWVHIDMAGPAWVEKQITPYAPYGGSGFGVRTLLNLLQTIK